MRREIIKVTVTCFEGEDGEIDVEFTPPIQSLKRADLEPYFSRVFKDSAVETFLACAQ
jgi:hypothetical protein